MQPKKGQPKLAQHSLSIWQDKQGNWKWSVHRLDRVVERGSAPDMDVAVIESRDALNRVTNARS